jgi:DNA-binding NarL/FixJ family response regulator
VTEPPRVVVVSGRDAAAMERALDSGTPVVVVGGDASVLLPRLTASGRAWGIVPEAASAALIDAAVGAVAAGLTVAPPDGVRGKRVGAATGVPSDVVEEPLTSRERDVLELVALGLSNHAIGTRLGISDHTVKFHLASIFGKLGVSTRTGAVRRGLTRGLITV